MGHGKSPTGMGDEVVVVSEVDPTFHAENVEGKHIHDAFADVSDEDIVRVVRSTKREWRHDCMSAPELVGADSCVDVSKQCYVADLL